MSPEEADEADEPPSPVSSVNMAKLLSTGAEDTPMPPRHKPAAFDYTPLSSRSTTKTVSPAQVSPYGSHVVTQEPSEDNSEDNSEGLTAYQMMMRPRSRPTTAHAPVSTDSSTTIRTTPPPRVPRIVRATQATPATPATPRASVPSSATVDLSYSNPTFETNSAFSPRLGLAAASPRSNVTLATRAGWSRVGLTGSVAEEFDATCRNAKDPDPLLHIENLEGQIRDRIVALHAAKAEVRLQARDSKDTQADVQHMQAMVKRYADMEMNAKARLNELRAESKQDKADLKEAKEELVQMKLAAVHHYKDRVTLQEKLNARDDLAAPLDRTAELEQELKAMRLKHTKQEAQIARYQRSMKSMQKDQDVLEEKAGIVRRKALADAAKDVERVHEALQAENRTLSRQLQNLRDSIVNGEHEKREQEMHQQMLSWQAQHRELKEKVRVLEREREPQRDQVMQAHRRLTAMSEVLQRGVIRSSRHTHTSDDGRAPVITDAVVEQALATMTAPEVDTQPRPLQQDPQHTPSCAMVDSVPAHVFDTLHQEIICLRRELKAREMLLQEKDAAVEVSNKKLRDMDRRLQSYEHQLRQSPKLPRSPSMYSQMSGNSGSVKLSLPPRSRGTATRQSLWK